MSTIKITNENFNELVNSENTTLVDFYADWCGPCRMLGPVIEEIANENKDIKVGKINVDDQPELAAAFRCESIPMLVAVKDGAIHNVAVGYREKADILKMLEI